VKGETLQTDKSKARVDEIMKIRFRTLKMSLKVLRYSEMDRPLKNWIDLNGLVVDLRLKNTWRTRLQREHPEAYGNESGREDEKGLDCD
jgi:hypothetical protein